MYLQVEPKAPHRIQVRVHRAQLQEVGLHPAAGRDHAGMIGPPIQETDCNKDAHKDRL